MTEKKYNIDFTLANYPNSGQGFLTEDYNDMFKTIFLFIEQHKKGLVNFKIN
mgnify:CR=1 FL=1